MNTLLKHSISVNLSQEAKLRRAWLSPGQAKFIATIDQLGHGAVLPVTHPERYELPRLGAVNAFAFRPFVEDSPSQEIAIADEHGVRRIELESSVEFKAIMLPRCNAVSYSSCGRFLATGSSKGHVRVFDLRGDSPKDRFEHSCSKSPIASLAFNAAGDQLFICTQSGELLCAELDDESKGPFKYTSQFDIRVQNQDIYALAAHSSAPLIAFGGSSNLVHLVETRRKRLYSVATGVGSIVKAIDCLDNSNQFVFIGSAAAEIWGLSSNGLKKESEFQITAGTKVLCAKQYGDTLMLVTQ
ncbi:MAG: hypothetical protein K2X27_13980 [Candidatus Obscuribacterales bacterium]|nr:hypothetical protein [Candidatus Obscuribacterales bacterium]